MANEVGRASDKAGNKGCSLKSLAANGPRYADSMQTRRTELHKQAGYTTATDSLIVTISNFPLPACGRSPYTTCYTLHDSRR